MQQKPRIALISSDQSAATLLQLRLQSKGYQAMVVEKTSAALGAFYSDPPDLIIVDFSSPCTGCREMLMTLRSDSFFSPIPIIGIFPVCDEQESWADFPLDDFIAQPINFGELFSRISLSLTRIKRIFDNNPLTRLPGNTSIQRAIEESMGWPLAVCYVDINHFKPYNDVFGFSHGDEVIRMLARIMSNAVRETGGGFCGQWEGMILSLLCPANGLNRSARSLSAILTRLYRPCSMSRPSSRAITRRSIARGRRSTLRCWRFPLPSCRLILQALPMQPELPRWQPI